MNTTSPGPDSGRFLHFFFPSQNLGLWNDWDPLFPNNSALLFNNGPDILGLVSFWTLIRVGVKAQTRRRGGTASSGLGGRQRPKQHRSQVSLGRKQLKTVERTLSGLEYRGGPYKSVSQAWGLALGLQPLNPGRWVTGFNAMGQRDVDEDHTGAEKAHGLVENAPAMASDGDGVTSYGQDGDLIGSRRQGCGRMKEQAGFPHGGSNPLQETPPSTTPNSDQQATRTGSVPTSDNAPTPTNKTACGLDDVFGAWIKSRSRRYAWVVAWPDPAVNAAMGRGWVKANSQRPISADAAFILQRSSCMMISVSHLTWHRIPQSEPAADFRRRFSLSFSALKHSPAADARGLHQTTDMSNPKECQRDSVEIQLFRGCYEILYYLAESGGNSAGCDPKLGICLAGWGEIRRRQSFQPKKHARWSADAGVGIPAGPQRLQEDVGGPTFRTGRRSAESSLLDTTPIINPESTNGQS
ncbi:hypothetical protein NM208_g12044 [Fusarium decemcellulare]|uniref:Uncharacterized protein n=1 Tax=Fusarium decemcellulare TaxID=57161 RepID=A0ACC1RQ85_9HYPO|nr:hypothetical protein NM208_g12044 [Fusarium decemcellulare]